MENLPRTKKSRLGADFSLDHTGGWGGRIKQNNDWKFHGYKGSNLGYDMMCESVNSELPGRDNSFRRRQDFCLRQFLSKTKNS